MLYTGIGERPAARRRVGGGGEAARARGRVADGVAAALGCPSRFCTQYSGPARRERGPPGRHVHGGLGAAAAGACHAR